MAIKQKTHSDGLVKDTEDGFQGQAPISVSPVSALRCHRWDGAGFGQVPWGNGEWRGGAVPHEEHLVRGKWIRPLVFQNETNKKGHLNSVL